MDQVRMRVTRIIDFGTIVSIVGTDLDTHKSLVVHVDHRPFQSIWENWKAAGFPQPITFNADKLTLSLDITRNEDGDKPAAA
jgi:hypothetical protein